MATSEQLSRPSRAPLRGLVGAGVAGLAAVLVAVGLAYRLDTPVDAGQGDPAPIQAGRAQVQPAGEAPELPPLAPLLERPLPPAVTRLGTLGEQLDALTRQAAAGEPAALIRLGAAQLRLRDSAGAGRSFAAALTRAPGSIEARIGALFAEAAASGDFDGAASELQGLIAANPRSQVARINQGWLAAYREDRETAIAQWRAAIAIAPDTALGRTARRLLTPVESGRSRATP